MSYQSIVAKEKYKRFATIPWCQLKNKFNTTTYHTLSLVYITNFFKIFTLHIVFKPIILFCLSFLENINIKEPTEISN